ncbi:MAG TPA: hypothetical protein VM389_08965 [Phycisphaerae bacterium]|nr:hypothetical protein [Phycisphaerae bacterium]
MNEQQAREKLIDLLYGELPPAEAEQVLEQVRAHPELAEELAALRRGRAAMAIGRAAEPATPVSIPAGRAMPWASRGLRWTGAAAAVGMAAAAGIMVVLFVRGTTGPAVAGPVEIQRVNVSLTILSEPEDMPAQPQTRAPTFGLGWRGLALVRDQRLVVNLPKGESRVRFREVPSAIRPDTVRLRSLDDPEGLTILEQNYQYDLASAGAILERYIDKPITAEFADGQRVTGVLLSFDDGTLVVRPAGQGPRNLHRRQVKTVTLAELPEGLLTKPTLVWSLANRAAAKQQIEVAYMTEGLSWRADYVLKLRPGAGRPAPDQQGMPQVYDAADVVGYATVTNRSGIAYADAQLKLMAGDVHLIRPEPTPVTDAQVSMSYWGFAAPQFQEKSFFEYHLYTLGRPTTLADRETKQIEMVTAAGVKMRRIYEYDRDVNPTAVRVISELVNSKANGLGKPLPKGVVRMYAPDPTGMQTYVAQTRIDHTPTDEKLRLAWGFAFDIVVEAKRTAYSRRGADTVFERWQYQFRNHKDHDVTVHVVVRVPPEARLFQADKPWNRPEAGKVEMDIPVKAASAETVTFEYEHDRGRVDGPVVPLPSTRPTPEELERLKMLERSRQVPPAMPLE